MKKSYLIELSRCAVPVTLSAAKTCTQYAAANRPMGRLAAANRPMGRLARTSYEQTSTTIGPIRFGWRALGFT